MISEILGRNLRKITDFPMVVVNCLVISDFSSAHYVFTIDLLPIGSVNEIVGDGEADDPLFVNI